MGKIEGKDLLGILRGALVNAGCRGDLDDQVGEAAVFALERLRAGAPEALAVWCAVRDTLRGRRAVRNRDYLRWGSCASRRGVYTLPGGSRLRYLPRERRDVVVVVLNEA